MIKNKYFDFDWIKGNLSDAEYARREKCYQKQIDNLKKNTNIAQRIFADINFNDARIVHVKPIQDSLICKFYIGDLQNGYYKVLIKFLKSKILFKLKNSNEIITSELCHNNGKFYFSFILNDLSENCIEFLDINKILFSSIDESIFLGSVRNVV